ncbi:MAG: DNA polymerase III subunit beta, partial [Microcystaceae cyanobacterium]
DNYTVTLTCEGASYQLQGSSATEFPEFPQLEEPAPTLTLPVETLIAGLGPTLSTCATDEIKPVLSGVRFHIEENAVEFVSLDGHRLTLVKKTTPHSLQEGAVTIPGKALSELLKLLKSGKPEQQEAKPSVTLSFNETQVTFTLPDAHLFCRSLAGAYPAYRELIPRQFQSETNIFTQSLKEAVQRLMLLNPKSPVICLACERANQQVNLSSVQTELGQGIEAVPAQVSGDFHMALNGKYLLEALKSLPTKEVQLQSNFSTTPAILKALTNDRDSCFVLLMPIFVQGFSEASSETPEAPQPDENSIQLKEGRLGA